MRQDRGGAGRGGRGAGVGASGGTYKDSQKTAEAFLRLAVALSTIHVSAFGRVRKLKAPSAETWSSWSGCIGPGAGKKVRWADERL